MSDQELSLQLVRVKCGDETNGQNAERFGNDEIWLSGFAVDATATVQKLEPFEIYAHFDDGDVKEFNPPKTLFSLKVPGGGTFPKSCVATLILAEKDYGGLSELAQEAFDKATEDMQEMKDEMGMEAGEQPPPDVWDRIKETVKDIAYDYLRKKIAEGLNDDVFPVQTASLDITSQDFRWGDGTKLSPETVIQYRGHGGAYYLTYYWEIRTLEGQRPGRGGPVIVDRPAGGGTLHL